jgi:sporulation protein YunB
MRKFKSGKTFKINYVPIIIIIIISLSVFIYTGLVTRLSPKLIDIVETKLKNANNELIMKFITTDILTKDSLNDIIELVKNNKDEIVAINYNMDNTYNLLKDVSNNLEIGLNSNLGSSISEYKTNVADGIILYYPIGLASSNLFINNLGPNVPVKVSYLSSLVTGVKTDVKNYGINNVMISIYLNVDVTNNIIVPMINKDINGHYEILLASKVVMGTVPNYLGSTLESQSPIISNNN